MRIKVSPMLVLTVGGMLCVWVMPMIYPDKVSLSVKIFLWLFVIAGIGVTISKDTLRHHDGRIWFYRRRMREQKEAHAQSRRVWSVTSILCYFLLAVIAAIAWYCG